MTDPLRGRVCVVTGASSGIGQATALALASRGASVVLLARHRERGTRVLETIRQRWPDTPVDLVLADLASLANLRRAADTIAARHDRVDALVNNAGAVNVKRAVTADGFEMTFGVNHLAPFALTHLLLPLLRAAAPARIVTVSSEAHRGAVLDFDDLQLERRYGVWLAYTRSKLANILFTRELARRLEGSGITANAVHPGAVRTRLGDGNGWALDVLGRSIKAFFPSPARGARGPLHLATAPEVATTTGRYFVKCREAAPSAAAQDAEAQARLWDVSRAATGLG